MSAVIAPIAGSALAAACALALFRLRGPAEPDRALDYVRALAEAYPPAERPDRPLPMASPAGEVAADADGLLVRVGEGDGFRRVPWSAVGYVLPVRGGKVRVHVADVGSLLVPGRFVGELARARGALPR